MKASIGKRHMRTVRITFPYVSYEMKFWKFIVYLYTISVFFSTLIAVDISFI